VVAEERGGGTLELLVAAPTSTELAILGRISASTALGLIAVPETLLIARALGIPLMIHEPLLFTIAMLALVPAIAGVGLIMSSAFVLARSTRLFQNVLGSPFYILAGVAFPVTLLPTWIQPLSGLVAISWGADVLRATATPSGGSRTGEDILAILLLAVIYLALGHGLFARIMRHIRVDGSVVGG